VRARTSQVGVAFGLVGEAEEAQHHLEVGGQPHLLEAEVEGWRC
jgi:hypothetical protein